MMFAQLLPTINQNRIKALFLHSWYHMRNSKETQIDLFWFPLTQFVIFGLIAKIISIAVPEIGKTLLLGFIFWEIVRVGQYCITVSMLWEIWSKSFNSLFISPLTMTEWLVGQMIAAVFKTSLVVISLAALGYFAYGFSLRPLGAMLVIYAAVLLIFSYAIGILVTALIIRYGTSIQSFAWGLIYLFQPISAVFYPLSALPRPMQWLGYTSPIMYVMEAAREQFATGRIDWTYISIASVLSVVYCTAAWWLLDRMYQRSRKTGEFARLGS